MKHSHESKAQEYLQVEQKLQPTHNAFLLLFFQVAGVPLLCADCRSDLFEPGESSEFIWSYGADVTTDGLFFAGLKDFTIERVLIGNTMVFNSSAAMPVELAMPSKLPAGAFHHVVPAGHDFLVTLRRSL